MDRRGARFAAAIGVAALVALFFVVAVPDRARATVSVGSTFASFAQSIRRHAVSHSGDSRRKAGDQRIPGPSSPPRRRALRTASEQDSNCSSSSCSGAKAGSGRRPQRTNP